jgi:protein tyrosine phosphatase
MIWENEVKTIVMLTKFIEKGAVRRRRRRNNGFPLAIAAAFTESYSLCLFWLQVKCSFYFPETLDEVKEMGTLRLRLVEEKSNDEELIERRFELWSTDITSERRIISHFHSVAWPDYGIPSSSSAFLSLIEKVNQTNANGTQPIVVHCR